MQKLRFRRIENQLKLVTNQWVAQKRFKAGQTDWASEESLVPSSDLSAPRSPQGTPCWKGLAFSLPKLSFFRKVKSWSHQGHGFRGTQGRLHWCVTCTIHDVLPMRPHMQQAPHLCHSVLKFLIVVEQGVQLFPFVLAPANCVAHPGLPVKCWKGRKYSRNPSLFFHIKSLRKSYSLFLQPISWHLSLLSLPSILMDQAAALEPTSTVVFQ